MSEQKKNRDWSFLLSDGKPSSRLLMEPAKIKDVMKELELDFVGFTLDDEASFREFVMAKTTPGDDIVKFLQKILNDTNIEYKENGFRRLTKQGYLELFFDLFTLGEENVASESPEVSPSIDAGKNPEADYELKPGVGPLVLEPLTLEKMDDLYNRGQKVQVDSRIISSVDFTITDKLPVRAQDGFSLRLSDKAPRISYGRAALYNTYLGNTVAVGHLEGDRQEPKLVFSAQHIEFASIKRIRKHEIILFPEDCKDNTFYAIECSLQFNELETPERTLCIDFGTSNTTAGSYGVLDEQDNHPEIVEFPDVDGTGTKKMLPTLVYVDSCEESQPSLVFGYEAKKRILADHFESKATVFHEIKSWMNDLDIEEDIFDAQGNNSKVRREDIVKAYLEHVISLSEQHFRKRFKYLHFSAPVKMKETFLNQMKKMFPAYRVLDKESSLDEGIAIVYDHIAKRIKENMKEGEEHAETVFVIDCGGGTTDLAKCKYWQNSSEIDKNKKILTVKTSFENGDSAFGGNNITYRILQLLKIKIDAVLQGKPNPDMLELLDDNEIDIMTKLDEPGKLLSEKAKLYERFEKAYEDAEAHIPTLYANATYNDDKRCMRRNYNYLWQLAEAIKIEFYKSFNTVSVDFSEEEDRRIFIGCQEDYYLYVRRPCNASLEKEVAPLGNIEITIKEISRILCPDIYALLIILLSDDDKNGSDIDKNKPLGVDFIRLSGQSCNITLFHDLMKEFVPGRKIRRPSDSTSGIEKAEELKLACLNGSIRYLMDKEYSQIKPEIKMDDPRLLYTVYEVDNDGKKKEQDVLRDGKAELIHHFTSGRRCKFVVENAYHQQKNSFIYNFEMDKNKRLELSLGDLEMRLLNETYWPYEIVHKSIIERLHNISQTEQCIFLLPAKNGYGLCIYQVRFYCDKGTIKYALIQKQPSGQITGEYHNFEKLESFFDGTR